MSQSPKVIRWGCISTGGIAMSFCRVRSYLRRENEKGTDIQDLLVDPSTRGTEDIQHKLVAIGSRTVESANKFIEKLKALPEPYKWGVDNGVMAEIKGYGSYEEVYNASVGSFLSILAGTQAKTKGCRCDLHRNTSQLSLRER